MLCRGPRRVNRDHGFILRASGLPLRSSAKTPDKGSDGPSLHVGAETRRREHDELEPEHQAELEAAERTLRAAH